MSETVSTVTVMEPNAIDDYVEDLMTHLRPLLLGRMMAWERLGLVAPPPEDVAQRVMEGWRAVRDSSAGEVSDARDGSRVASD